MSSTTSTTGVPAAANQSIIENQHYQAEELKIRAKRAGGKEDHSFWMTADQLTPAALSTTTAAYLALETANDCVGGNFFARKYLPVSLVKLRGEIGKIVCCEYIERFLDQTSPIVTNHKAIMGKIKELKQTTEILLTKADKTDSSSESNVDEEVDAASDTATVGVPSIAELSQQITDLMTANKELIAAQQNEISARLQTLRENPIKDDRRSQGVYVAKLDRVYYTPNHDQYKAKLADWTTKGYVKKEFTQEDCWRWSAEVEGLEHIAMRYAHLANSMETAEAVFNTIIAHQNDAQFFTVSEADKELLKAREKAECENTRRNLEAKMAEMGIRLPGMGMGFPGMGMGLPGMGMGFPGTGVRVSGDRAAALLAALLV